MPEIPVANEGWQERPQLDLLSTANLDAVRESLRGTGAVLFGWHYHYAGGSSRTLVQFTELTAYLEYVERSRPGDHFTLFAIDQVAPRAVLRLGRPNSSARLVMDQQDSTKLFGLLQGPEAEVVVVRRFVGPLTSKTVVDISELDETDAQDWQGLTNSIFWGLGELMVFAGDVFDEDGDGDLVTTVTPSARRVYALVDAKRPDAEGRVPLSGPY